MEEEKKTTPQGIRDAQHAERHSEESLKHWRSWGSWYSWGSATGFSIFLLSIGGFILLLHLAGLIGR